MLLVPYPTWNNNIIEGFPWSFCQNILFWASWRDPWSDPCILAEEYPITQHTGFQNPWNHHPKVWRLSNCQRTQSSLHMPQGPWYAAMTNAALQHVDSLWTKRRWPSATKQCLGSVQSGNSIYIDLISFNNPISLPFRWWYDHRQWACRMTQILENHPVFRTSKMPTGSWMFILHGDESILR